MNDLVFILSTFNEEQYIDRCLEAVFSQTRPAQAIVVDGGSRDGTVSRLHEWARREPRLRVVADGVHRTLPEALNNAIALTDAAFVAKVDARTFIARDFAERAVSVFEKEGAAVACVGGRPEQYGETPLGEGVARARMSRFGVGGSGYADERPYADVDTVQCGIYRRCVLLGVGGFDPSLQYGEDEELNWRIRQAGYRIVRDTSIRFRYVTRPTWMAAFRQYRNYGRARVRVWRKHPEFLRPHHFAPSAMVLLGGVAVTGAVVWRPMRYALAAAGAAYGAAAMLAAASVCRDLPKMMPQTAGAFTALHCGYGIGFIEGLAER